MIDSTLLFVSISKSLVQFINMDCVTLTGDQVLPMIEDMVLVIMGQHRFQFLVWLFPIIEDGLLKKQLRQKKWLPTMVIVPASFKSPRCIIT